MKKKILIVIAANNGTIGMCSRNLYLAFKYCADYDVKCVGVHHYENGLEEFEDIEYYQSSTYKPFSRVPLLSQSLWLRKIKKQFNPDITISTLFSVNTINVLSGGNGLKAGVFHSPHQQTRVKGLLFYIFVLLQYALCYPLLDKLCCVSQEVKDSLKYFPFIRDKKKCVIYNVHNIEKIHKLSADAIEDDYEKLIFSKPVILYCGRFDENKAPIRSVEAFAKASVAEDAQLVFIGGGDDAMWKRLKDKAEDLKIGNRIHYFGKKSNPYKYMGASRALISSSYSEGLPGVMIESLILGRPVVTTNSSKGIWEIFSCVDEYDSELPGMHINECGAITSNLSHRDKSAYNRDIDNLSKGISTVMTATPLQDFKFEEKVKAENIVNQFLS